MCLLYHVSYSIINNHKNFVNNLNIQKNDRQICLYTDRRQSNDKSSQSKTDVDSYNYYIYIVRSFVFMYLYTYNFNDEPHLIINP